MTFQISLNLASICSMQLEWQRYICRPPPRLGAKQRQRGKLTLSQAANVANTTQQHKTIHGANSAGSMSVYMVVYFSHCINVCVLYQSAV